MKIIEKFCQSKNSATLCEDALVITDSFIAVIDGVTSKSDTRYNGKTSGRTASEVIGAVIKELPQDCTIFQFIASANSAINAIYQCGNVSINPQEYSIQATCAVYSHFRRELWLIGDCQIMIDNSLYQNPKKSDGILSDMRTLTINCLKAENIDSSDIIALSRNVILPWIIKSCKFANDATSEYGYAVINGCDIPEALIKVIKLDRKTHEIILASDGYPVLLNTLALSEASLESLLIRDPFCITFPSTKAKKAEDSSFDDRAYIRFTI